MALQYITDSNGKTTGVFIPIKEWDEIKAKLTTGEALIDDVPNWHKVIVRRRMELYKNGTEQPIDFEQAIEDIEKSL
jgi:hypothetical protein